MSKHILLASDLPGYGKVALAAMIPVLSHMGHHVYTLPTALVSNTLDYGLFDIMETTDYMKKTMAVWDKLGFSFDAVATGFIVSGEQAAMLAEYGASCRRKGAFFFVDPIMGDEGHLYNGVPPEAVDHMKPLIAQADCIVPNYTEAALLTGIPYKKEGTTDGETKTLLDALSAMGAASVVITSARVDGRDAVAGYDGKTGAYFTIPFDAIPVRFPGTGDIFSSVLLGHLLNGEALPSSVKKAMDTVAALIRLNEDNADKYKGIPLESCLEVIQ